MDAVLEALDKIYTSLENKHIVTAVFLDFSKAFDTVNLSILLAKLNHIGIRARTNNWFASYLNDRVQSVNINNLSSFKPITLGVPQGYILGRNLFLLYINDMANSTRDLKFIHFADDTPFFCLK